MIDDCETDEVVAHFGALAHPAIGLDTLRDFLIEHEGKYTSADGKLDSRFTKAVCLYDLVRFGPKTDWTAS